MTDEKLAEAISIDLAKEDLTQPSDLAIASLRTSTEGQEVVTQKVYIKPLHEVHIMLCDSGPGGEPPFRVQAYLEGESFYLDEIMPQELVDAVEKARAIIALNYRKRKGA
jgi:hypothetical protein